MENHQMVQKRLWKAKEFRLDDGILHHKEIGLLSGFEVELRYEDIVGEKRTRRQPNYYLFAAAGVLMWLSCANIIGYGAGVFDDLIVPLLGMFMSTGLFYVVYANAQEVLYLDTVDNGSIGFFRDANHQVDVDTFVANLLEHRKIFLVEKYWDCVDGYDQKMQNLDWLKDRNVVNIDEFKYLKEEMLLQEEEAEILPIGFHRRKCS